MDDAKPANGDGLPEEVREARRTHEVALRDCSPNPIGPEAAVWNALSSAHTAIDALIRRLATHEQPGSSVQGEALRRALQSAYNHGAAHAPFPMEDCIRQMSAPPAPAAEQAGSAVQAAPGVLVDDAMVGDVRADIMRSAANDGCPIVIKDAWVREALTAALAPDGGEGE